MKMSILGVNSALAGVYQYADRAQKTGKSGGSFTEQLQETGEAADALKVETYPQLVHIVVCREMIDSCSYVTESK